MKATCRSIHPSEHIKPKQIPLKDRQAVIARKDITNICTDGSNTEKGVGAAFCVLTNDIWSYQWFAKFNEINAYLKMNSLHFMKQ
ncbi:hypothetical protein AVEN_215788-1 [Araneus ventricosus]|uniref:RNase H type-1 domain-containing protein n=1 Tax=Araneus ventricosus TaxID=182803 RepID=A0A4Y2J583_ARAVE|nr:hypothetical protein AVEN_215788-1 [Araneus ventricosus]